jgi:hypothetical protein
MRAERLRLERTGQRSFLQGLARDGPRGQRLFDIVQFG